MVNTLISELEKIGTNRNGIAVATDIFNYITLGEGKSDAYAVKLIAQLFVERNQAKIIALHDKAINWNGFIGNKYGVK